MTDQPVQTAAYPSATRAALRREKIAARLALPAAAHRSASVVIQHHLNELLLPLQAGTVAFCWPIRAEVDCRPVIARMADAGWRAAMPVVATLDAPMEFRLWWPAAPMMEDPYGIPIPDTETLPAPSVILLPLVAFDADGYRLGYGGGYFDRTLAALEKRPMTIGVGFELSRVADIHPQMHDVPLDMVVTETGIRRFNDA